MYVCLACGYVYDPEKGDPDSGIAPGTAFEDIPDDWVCPICGVGKDMFERAKNPLYKNAKGIRFAQETIILSTFSKMKQRDISKENNDTEVEQD